MTRACGVKLAIFSTACALVLSDAEVAAHVAKHSAVPSTLPPPHYVGDAATRLARAYGGTPIDVLTYHYNPSRTGWNGTETDLTPASVASSKFGLLATLNVDGNVLAQPLLVSNFVFPNGKTHNVLIIATGHDSLYAYDAQTYSLLWKVSLGTPQSSADLTCYDVQPEYGISSTPVIFRASANTATIFVVAATEPSPGTFVSSLHALDLATGKDRHPPAVMSPSATLNDGSTVTFDPMYQWNRAGLAFGNNSVYVGVGSHCDGDGSNITGWLLRYNGSLALQSAFHTVETHGGTELASIWMSGFAPAIDSQGYLYLATGNGDFTQGRMDWGESVLKLPPQLSTVSSWFSPDANQALSNLDEDLGSGGVMLIPSVTGQQAPPLAVSLGKFGTLYLLNRNSLGGLSPNDSGVLQGQWAGGGVWGGPAYYVGPSGPTVFTAADTDVLRSWSVNTSATPALTQGANGTSVGGMGGSIPIVSSYGAKPHTGVVWLINRANEPFSIEAYDATLLGNPIFQAQVGTWSNTDANNPFLTPMEANGRVYAPGYLLVRVYGLTQ